MTSLFATLSPAWFSAAGFLVTASAVALVALHSVQLALAGRRTVLPARTQVAVPVLAALLLGAWLGWAVIETHQLALAGPPPGPRSPLAALPTLAAILIAIALGSSFLAFPAVRAFNTATPSAWLIRLQVYRTAGLMFIWPFLPAGILPAGFALPAGIGDAITGLGALVVARAIDRRRPGAYRWAVLWNWFGILDLVVAPTAAVLSGTQLASIAPLGLIPLFLGPPLGILTHIYSLRNLAANRQELTQGAR